MAIWIVFFLAVVAAGCWLLVSRPVRRRGGWLMTHPAHRGWLAEMRLVEPDDFLNLQALVVSGHPGRQVLRLRLGERIFYLKRQEKVRWSERLANLAAGFGWASRCRREAHLLRMLEAAKMPAPRCLAAGEDWRGRAFLLVEGVADARPLVELLKDMPAPQRRRFAGSLGEQLAALHEAGFLHRDLYAKHVLIGPGQRVCLLDWQRGEWRARVGLTARVRDLAALHATLPDELASPRERLALLKAYSGSSKGELPRFLDAIRRETRRMLRHRHIREKRQPPAAEQAWFCHDGEALCVTPALAHLYPGDEVRWLALDNQPAPATGQELRRWVTLPNGRHALLVRRRDRVGLAARLRAAWAGHHSPAEHQRRATMLWRLERHGVTGPRVLAVGRRTSARRSDSFLLAEPLLNTIPLLAWLRRPDGGCRDGLLRRLGSLLARLHEGCCYLGSSGVNCLSVQHEGDECRPVLDHVDGLASRRRPSEGHARHDFHALKRCLLELVGEAGWGNVERGYLELQGKTPGPQSLLSRAWQRLLHGESRWREQPDWATHAGPDWQSRIMDVPLTDRCSAKQGRTTGRWVVEGRDGNLTVYLKRHFRPPLFRRLMALLWPAGDWSPAMWEYNHLQWANAQGVPVPRAVAAGEFVGPGLRLHSYLAVEELTGMLPLQEAIPLACERLSPDAFRRWKRGLIKELARLARLLHDRRRFHKDFYLCHFFIREEDTAACVADWAGQVFLIDLHRLEHHPRTWPLWLVKDLGQLLFSSGVPGIGVRDRVRFWREYRNGAPWGAWNRWLAVVVRFKCRRYLRHNIRRRGE